jgi:hypothetical protein
MSIIMKMKPIMLHRLYINLSKKCRSDGLEELFVFTTLGFKSRFDDIFSLGADMIVSWPYLDSL